MRLINADELVELYKWRIKNASSDGNADMYRQMLWDIAHAPTIEAEPVCHGRWIRMDDTFARWKCSECGAIEDHSGWPYCHCGAKMDLKGD